MGPATRFASRRQQRLENTARQNAVWRGGRRILALIGAVCLVMGCSKPTPKSDAITPTNENVTQAPVQAAKIGAPAPDFDLPDLDGKRVKLSDLRGKIVVLEWFNPECPFVRASHTKGSLVDTAKRQTEKGIVWLGVNSGGAGKQGHGVEKNREGQQRFGLTHPILLDETGKVGKSYEAEHTPHMYVIDAKGVLVYRGAIDNSPDGEGESLKDGKLVNYVDAALADLAAGRPVATAETEAYGCSVKYVN